MGLGLSTGTVCEIVLSNIIKKQDINCSAHDAFLE